jgi:outer membrane protein assembly factor BamB
MHCRLFGTLVVVGVVARAANAQAAVTVTGTVFVDANGDGLVSPGEAAMPGVIVAWETTAFATTDAQGRYSLSVPGDGIVWVRTPDGFAPAPTWRAVSVAGGNTTVDLPLTPSRATGEVVFLDAADSHVGVTTTDEVRFAMTAAASLVPAPHFLTIVGDLTDRTDDAQFKALADAQSGMGIPFVPIVGNHDWYDGGAAYRKRLGPPMYSFDTGGVHFVVLNMMASEGDRLGFVARDLAMPRSGIVAAFQHSPPPDAFADKLAAAGVEYLFTGHAHANKVTHHGSLLELNTEPIVFGGLDFTPAGYRVVGLVNGELRSTHHVTVERPVLTLSFPRPGSCVDAGTIELAVAAEVGPSTTTVTVTIDGDPPTPLHARGGGWDYTGTVALAAGTHTVVVTATSGGQTWTETDRVCARPAVAAAPAGPEWPQLGATSVHQGATPTRLRPPLRNVWARALGGHVFGGSPVVAGGLVYAPVVDLADGTMGGVVALDLLTGAEVWAARAGSVRNAPAVADGRVMFATTDGVLHAVDAATGHEQWTLDLGQGSDDLLSWLYAAPTVDQGLVYIGGQRKIVAADVRTGAVVWSHDPNEMIWAVTLSSMAVGGGVGVGVVGRGGQGVLGWDGLDGAPLWTIGPPVSSAVMAAPVIDGDKVYLTNFESHICAADLLTGQIGWATKLYDSASDFRYGIVGTPALAGGRLFVPTPKDDLFAVDAASGRALWHISAEPTIIRPLPYGQAGARAFLAAPAVTGDLVWVGGADGILRAVDAATGTMAWSADLGTPILSGVVPSPPYLVVGTFDGTVRALTEDPQPPPMSVEGGGCAVGGGASGDGLAVLLLIVAVVRPRRRPPRARGDGRAARRDRRQPLPRWGGPDARACEGGDLATASTRTRVRAVCR